jgi:hypothetical protein
MTQVLSPDEVLADRSSDATPRPGDTIAVEIGGTRALRIAVAR